MPAIPKPRSRAADKKDAKREQEKQWRKVRKLVLIRDDYRCRACGTKDHVDVHHLKFRSAGGSDTDRNLLCLDRICHADVHSYRLTILGDDANGKLRFVRRDA
jgi:5-methylcytosine-specific restriction endonuclease McrA